MIPEFPTMVRLKVVLKKMAELTEFLMTEIHSETWDEKWDH
jgi:hypothetical protein